MLQRWRSKFQARYGFVEADTSEPRVIRQNENPAQSLGTLIANALRGYEGSTWQTARRATGSD